MTLKRRVAALESRLPHEPPKPVPLSIEIVLSSRAEVAQFNAIARPVTFCLPAGQELPQFMTFEEFVKSIEEAGG